jgi:CMP/dCMP kinase
VPFSETTPPNLPPLIVAIDGPAASGKSTTARAVAERTGYVYLDTGAMYRALALAHLRSGAEEDWPHPSTDDRISVRYMGKEMRVFLDGEDVSGLIRSPEVSAMASRISTIAAVREEMVALQRRIAHEQLEQGRGVVLDGRDIGTVVFPDADVKIFMIADPKTRARRRHAEMRSQGTEAAEDQVLAEMQERDQRDTQRSIAPLRKAEDAIELDTTAYTIDEQVGFTIEKIRERMGGNPVTDSSY